jgi:hypothetical protein
MKTKARRDFEAEIEAATAKRAKQRKRDNELVPKILAMLPEEAWRRRRVLTKALLAFLDEPDTEPGHGLHVITALAQHVLVQVSDALEGDEEEG